mmetsp:Transcript_61314/g.200500  ORF Transcript_61314/g.200500 Transcript_61314/m.200500 type:complete len:573 (+) Transcript_61314:73-1791(+)
MEVQIDISGLLELPSDAFVSMRIGDVQKQARLSASRTFRFPQPAPGRENVGRIEVFKRVGTAVVTFDNSGGTMHNIKVRCDDPSLQTLNMQVKLKGGKDGSLPQLTSTKAVQLKLRKDAAQAYLDDYGIESALAEIMREVIVKKPKDAYQFLAGQLLKKSMDGDSLPELAPLAPKTPQSKPVQKPGAEESLPQLSLKASQPSALFATEPPRLLPPIASTKAPPADLGSFGKYFSENFRSVDAVTWTKLHSKFPQATRELKIIAKQPTLKDWGRYCQEYMVSPPSDALKTLYAKFNKPPRVEVIASLPKPSGFSECCMQHLKHSTAGSMQTLYSKFPAFVKASAAAAAAGVKSRAEAKRASFATMPSVGTWLQPRPTVRDDSSASSRPMQVVAKQPFYTRPSVGMGVPQLRPNMSLVAHAKLVESSSTEAATGRWSSLPSVGTWLSAKPEHEARAVEFPGKKPDLLGVAWQSLPSVGTWLSAKPVHEDRVVEFPGKKPDLLGVAWLQRPSVGSWLMGKPVAQPSPVVLSSNADELEKLDKTVLIQAVQHTLVAKDQEIEELKRTIERMKMGLA